MTSTGIVIRTSTDELRRSRRLKGKEPEHRSPYASSSKQRLPGGYDDDTGRDSQTPRWDDVPDRDRENDPQPEQDENPYEADDNAGHGGDGGQGGGGGGDDGGDDNDNGGYASSDAGDAQRPDWARAMDYLARNINRNQSVPLQNPRAPRTRAREPEPFSGANPDDLPKFLFQCRLYFRANPAQFESDRTKVNFALTFLTDVALRWFETGVDQEETYGIHHSWATSWDDFTKELKTHFGLADLQGESAELLEALKMKADEKITSYNVEFMRLASQLRWADNILCYRYYKGLPDRLKDVHCDCPGGKPSDYARMREVALKLDNRFWERQREKTRARAVADAAVSCFHKKSGGQTHSEHHSSSPTSNTKPGSNNSGNNNNSNNSNNKPNNSNNNNKGNSNKPATHSNTPSASSKPFAPKPDLSDKLGKDGKLTSDKRKRRLDNNLCLFCGNAGHKVSDCRKKAASNAKASARKAEATEKSSEKSSGK
jgi:hypothetical protein